MHGHWMLTFGPSLGLTTSRPIGFSGLSARAHMMKAACLCASITRKTCHDDWWHLLLCAST